MFTISVETCFRASHQLTLPDGSKERLHRYNWSVIANVAGRRLNDMGLVMDFRRLKEMLDAVTAELDDNRMTNLDYFQQKNASAENVAEYIHRKLEKKLPKGVKLAAVSIIEKRGCSAKYTKIR